MLDEKKFNKLAMIYGEDSIHRITTIGRLDRFKNRSEIKGIFEADSKDVGIIYNEKCEEILRCKRKSNSNEGFLSDIRLVEVKDGTMLFKGSLEGGDKDDVYFIDSHGNVIDTLYGVEHDYRDRNIYDMTNINGVGLDNGVKSVADNGNYFNIEYKNIEIGFGDEDGNKDKFRDYLDSEIGYNIKYGDKVYRFDGESLIETDRKEAEMEYKYGDTITIREFEDEPYNQYIGDGDFVEHREKDINIDINEKTDVERININNLNREYSTLNRHITEEEYWFNVRVKRVIKYVGKNKFIDNYTLVIIKGQRKNKDGDTVKVTIRVGNNVIEQHDDFVVEDDGIIVLMIKDNKVKMSDMVSDTVKYIELDSKVNRKQQRIRLKSVVVDNRDFEDYK